MNPSPTITLFSERPEWNQRSSSFVVSILAHGVAFTLVSLGFLSTPQLKPPATPERYAVRQLDLDTLEPLLQQALQRQIASPRVRATAYRRPAAARPSAAQSPAMPRIAHTAPELQTLVQPDLLKPLPLPRQIPLPTVVIWNGEATPVKTIRAPLPQKPVVADVQPSIQRPNEEKRLADLSLSASDLATASQPILPGTTSPVVVRGPQPTPPAPVTTTKGSLQATPIAVMSLSNLQMAKGDVTLPPANQSASKSTSGAFTPGYGKDSAHPDPFQAAANSGKSRPGSSTGDTAEGQNPDVTRQASTPGSLNGNPLLTAHIVLPKNGHFGSIVVGDSLQDQYPEIIPIWGSRLGYTVYLHVGLEKSWILQYSLPPAVEAADAGQIQRVEPPWPYNIVRPNLAPDAVNADALMVHGYVNPEGRFESLSIAFPPQFPQTKFVLDALAQWQFRPATQNGKNVRVEVLLVIPEEQE
ncbi:MAG: energy transducer TonB [Terracidiphilus sp.]